MNPYASSFRHLDFSSLNHAFVGEFFANVGCATIEQIIWAGLGFARIEGARTEHSVSSGAGKPYSVPAAALSSSGRTRDAIPLLAAVGRR